MRQSSLIGHTIEIYWKYIENPEKPADALIRQFFYERKYLHRRCLLRHDQEQASLRGYRARCFRA
jgi:hypothetical protein